MSVVETYKCGSPKGPRSLAVVSISEAVDRILDCPHVIRVRRTWDTAIETVELSTNDLKRLLEEAGRDRL